MALTITVRRGYEAQANKPIFVDDLNAGFLPIVEVDGLVGPGDIADGAVRINHLYAGFLAGAQAVSAVAGTDQLLLGVNAGTANRSVTVAALLSGMWTTPAAVTQCEDWGLDRFLFQDADGVMHAMTPATLASSLVKQAPVASALGDYAANLIGVNQASGMTGMTIANLAKALVAQAPGFSAPETLTLVDELLVHDVSSGQALKTTLQTLAAAAQLSARKVTDDLALPTTSGTASVKTAHGFSKAPTELALYFRCVTAEAGYAINDIIPSHLIFCSSVGGETPAYIPVADASQIYFVAAWKETATYNIPHKAGTQQIQVFTPGNWKAFLVAHA